MCKIVSLIALLICLSVLSAQPIAEPIKSANSELALATQFLANRADRDYLQCFTTYDIPDNLLEKYEIALSYTVNSTSNFKNDGKIQRPKRVTGSNSLWYIDVRDYGWTKSEFLFAAGIEPFFRIPLVDQSAYGNILLRADWFVYNALDTTVQEDRGDKEFLYYVLSYGVGNAPKNLKQFQDFWRVNINQIRAEYIETGGIIDKGKSGVSRHARQVRRARTIFGFYWETRDVKTHEIVNGKTKDVVEDIFANHPDAFEYFATDKFGFIRAGLADDKQNTIQKADPTIVVDRSDPDDVRVRTVISCLACHAVGINPYNSDFRDFVKNKGNILAYDYELKKQIEAFYLKNNDSNVKADNVIYGDAVQEACGIDPIAASKAIVDVYRWYRNSLTVEQCAKECGLPTNTFKKIILPGVSGRLNYLLANGEIPRDVWDSINNGGYTQAMLLYRVGKLPVQEQAKKPVLVVDVTNCALRLQNEIIIRVPINTVFDKWTINQDWFGVTYKGREGYIHKSEIRHELR